MKLTRKDRNALESVLYHAKRALTYIEKPSIAVCHRDTVASTTLHYSRHSDGAVLYEVEKSYGSDLCGLRDTVTRLERILNPVIEEVVNA